jgi:hypothetical protein
MFYTTSWILQSIVVTSAGLVVLQDTAAGYSWSSRYNCGVTSQPELLGYSTIEILLLLGLVLTPILTDNQPAITKAILNTLSKIVGFPSNKSCYIPVLSATLWSKKSLLNATFFSVFC